MSSKNVAVKEETGTAIAIMADMEQDIGKGFENVTTKNVSIPYLSLAQSASDRVKKGPGKVEGLEEGDFLNTATMEIFKSGTFRVVPCGFQMRWIERDGKGKDAQLVATHEDGEIEKRCTKDEKGKLQLPDGNYITPTAMHFVLIVKEDGSFQPGVISLGNSQLKRSKDWFALMQGLKIKTAGGKMVTPPTMSHSYLVTSVSKSNAEGSWMVWTFSAPKMLESADLYTTAKAFNEEVNKGLVKVAEPVADSDAPTGATSEHF